MRLTRVAAALRAVIVPAVVAALVAFPLGVLASHSFTDVPTTHPFHNDIAALKDSGVSTTGCGGGKFCPDDFVTRGQMAAFLNRLGALGPGKVPVVNADKLDGLDSTAFGRSYGDGRQVSNVNDFECDQDVVVGTQPVTISKPSRIWIFGQGVVRDGSSDATDYGLWLQLRNAGDTTTLAVSTRAWDTASDGGQVALVSGGIMLATDDPDANAPAFVAPVGAYILQLAVTASGACTDLKPDFGFNQGNGMGYVLLGTQ